jgi:S1-C subfamily serine protease
MKKLLAYLMIILCLLLPGAVLTAGANDTVTYSYAADQLRRHSFIIEVLVPLTTEVVDVVDGELTVIQLPVSQWKKIGSGTLVEIDGSPNVLTAWHIAEDAIDREMRACPALERRDKCVRLTYPWMSDMQNVTIAGDWALFQILKAPEGMKPAKMRRQPIIVGETVNILASPTHNEGLLTQGIVSGYVTVGDVDLIKTDAFAFLGSSGGGVYDKRGRLLGVLVAIGEAYDTKLPHNNISVPVCYIRDFLEAGSQ